ncbi:MAG: HEAT repeat domain-containing protein [Synechococcaceae cyanobacterium RM1_1_27]|nr:HEAT repeat domain-containing protein [Synechococcaceae cyanobacterium RM1_1_27]
MSFPPVSQSVSQSDGGTGSPDLELLVQHLEQATDPGQMVRAVEALGSCGQVGALPHLIKAFGFNRPGVADRALAAVVALTALGGQLTNIFSKVSSMIT